MIVKKDSTDITTYVKMIDSAAGTPETGLTITNIDITYTRNRAAAVKADITALAAVDSAHGDNKGIQIDATNAPGLYRIDWPDAAFATGVDKVILSVTCSGCDPVMLQVDLVNYDPADAVRLGLTALPNAAADAAGGLPISDAGGLDLDGIKTKTDFLPSAAAGSAGGVAIAGSNAATTFASLTCTGALTVSDGIAVTCSTLNRTAVSATGNGTGNGLTISSGAGLTGSGISVACGGTNGSGMLISGAGSGHGVSTAGGTTGHGLHAQGGGTTGNGINADGGYTGSGIRALGYLTGNGITATGGSTTGAGILATGGANHASADGIRATAGGALANGIETDRILANNTLTVTEGIAAAITGNITGNLSGSIGTCPNPAGVTTLLAKLPGDTKTGAVTTDAGNSATSFETNLSEAVNDYWKDCLLLITSGALIGQVKKVTGYVGATKIITVSGGFTSTPADDVTFILINQ